MMTINKTARTKEPNSKSNFFIMTNATRELVFHAAPIGRVLRLDYYNAVDDKNHECGYCGRGDEEFDWHRMLHCYPMRTRSKRPVKPTLRERGWREDIGV